MWAVLYDDGMSLTTASELIARSLAEAERQRGHPVTVRHLDDVETHPRGAENPARPPGRARGDCPVRPRGTHKPSVPGPSRVVGSAGSAPEPEPIRPVKRFARPELVGEPEPAAAPEPAPVPELTQVLGPTQAVEPAQGAEPALEAAVCWSRTRLTACAGIAASVAAAVLVLAAPGHWPALAGALLLACVPTGAAVMCWVDTGDGPAQAGLTLVLSLAVTAIASAIMIWLAAWHPGALLALAAASVLSCVARLWRGTRLDADGQHSGPKIWRQRQRVEPRGRPDFTDLMRTGTPSKPVPSGGVTWPRRTAPTTRFRTGAGLRSRTLREAVAPRLTGVRQAEWPVRRGLQPQLVLPVLGLGSWAYGVSQLRRQVIGPYGLLASANGWFFLGLAALLAGCLIELNRPRPRSWLLGTYLAVLIVAIHATVPIIYGGTPQYEWVYKHIGVAQALGRYGRVTDRSDIYQQWPTLFAAVASVSRLVRVGPLSFAAWGPVAFELADALMLLGVFRMLAGERRVAYVALLLYEALTAWVGQDYLSPQAFGNLLWLGIVTIVVRWLLVPPPAPGSRSVIARARAPFLAGLRAPPESTPALRTIAVTLVVVIDFAIVTAHELTPYTVLLGLGALVLLGLLWRGWLLVLVLAAIAGGYLASRYSLIAYQYGGLFSGGNPFRNASGSTGTFNKPAEQMTALIVRALAVCMWLLALAALARQRRELGRVVIAAVLAFSPFAVLFMQRYGGEAIYRVYLFSAPWCALLIAGALVELRGALSRWLVTACVCALALAAGLQGLYGHVAPDAFTPAELTASGWLYGHARHGALIVLAADDFPVLETADYNSYNLRVMPADPQYGAAWMDEANVSEVEAWIASLGYRSAYVVFSRSMANYVDYFGAPEGYMRLLGAISARPGWSVVYSNADTVIYRVHLR